MNRMICTALLLCIASYSAASELSDSMELFFAGNYKDAQQRLTALIDAGHKDARLHYFRGLASHRRGELQAASRDFQAGAILELSGTHRTPVGQALQRVQGAERLLLEKYRTMARLAAGRRDQPIAPRPPVAKQPTDGVRLANAQSVGPRYRLASEVPLRAPTANEGVDEEMVSLIAGEQQPNAPVVVSSADQREDGPVGTGVIQAEATLTEPRTNAFDDFDVRFTDTPQQPAAQQPSKPTSVFGAMFRALRNATIPRLDAQSLLPSGVIPGGSETTSYDPEDDPFGDAPFEDSFFEDDAATAEQDDPFGDFDQ